MLSLYQKFNDYIKNSLPKSSQNQITDGREGFSMIAVDDAYINCLPEEIMLNIFANLSLDDLCNCSLVSEKWNRICDDALLWKFKLSIESFHWAGIIPKSTARSKFVHPKDTYLSLTPILSLSSIEWIRSGFFVYFSLIVKSYLGHKSPHIAVMGSGLDNFRTKRLFDDMFHNKCSEFEPIGQFMPSVGSGITMKLISDDNYSYKFHFYLLYSFKAMAKFTHSFQVQRIRMSILFNRLDSEEPLDNLEMADNVKEIFTNLQGLIYAIDGQDNETDYQALVYEFKEAVKAIHNYTPVLIILINSHKTNTTRISTFQVAQLFDLMTLSNPWCILTASARDTHVVKLGIIWLIQKTFKM